MLFVGMIIIITALKHLLGAAGLSSGLPADLFVVPPWVEFSSLPALLAICHTSDRSMHAFSHVSQAKLIHHNIGITHLEPRAASLSAASLPLSPECPFTQKYLVSDMQRF